METATYLKDVRWNNLNENVGMNACISGDVIANLSCDMVRAGDILL